MSLQKDADEYEITVHELVRALHEQASYIPITGYGKSNKVGGASTYQHQIDITLETPEYLVLVECKKYSSNVDVPEFLTFVERRRDIQTALGNKKVEGVVVTTQGFSSGVILLASYHQIELQKVVSPAEFALYFRKFAFIGISEHLQAKENIMVQRLDDFGNKISEQDFWKSQQSLS